jgi:hypothetical protein
METLDDELEKMYKWIKNTMKPNIWYPVKSDKAFDLIKRLFNEGLISFCEFDETQTHIRKIDDELFNQIL